VAVLLLAGPINRALSDPVPANQPDYPALRAELQAIQESDQKYRLQIADVEKAHGINSPEMQALWATISEHDHDNLAKVMAILDQYGWIGPDKIGWKANLALFLVVQHSDLKAQEKYLPMMRDAVAAHNASASSLALLEDRVALGEHRLQTYGSQIGQDNSGRFYVLPLEDPDHVDDRRKGVGLGTLADYVKQWGIAWDPAAYEKSLAVLEAETKN
jgi:hypothetical protein